MGLDERIAFIGVCFWVEREARAIPTRVMKVSTLSAVASVGDRPRRRLSTNEGSPIACRPNSVGLKPEHARKTSTRSLKWLLIVVMHRNKIHIAYCVNWKRLLISYSMSRARGFAHEFRSGPPENLEADEGAPDRPQERFDRDRSKCRLPSPVRVSRHPKDTGSGGARGASQGTRLQCRRTPPSARTAAEAAAKHAISRTAHPVHSRRANPRRPRQDSGDRRARLCRARCHQRRPRRGEARLVLSRERDPSRAQSPHGRSSHDHDRRRT